MGITKEQFRDAISQVKTFVLGKTSNMVPKTRTINGKALSEDITLKASDIGADASGTAANQITSHNISTTAHNDIRLLITGLTDRMNALANSDDTTLDQMKEVVAYIKTNRELIESITTAKINVDDIIDNLETNVANKPLSAAQGVALKVLIDTLQASVETLLNNYDTLKKSVGAKLLYGGNSNLNLDIRHSITSQTITALEPNKSIDFEIDISSYNYKSLIYAVPQLANITLRIVYRHTL